MIGFLQRFLKGSSNEPNNQNQSKIPTLLLGKTLNKYKEVYLPIIENNHIYSRSNHLVIAQSPYEVYERIFTKYIRQDFKYQEAYHANTEVLISKNEWNDPSFQSQFLSNVSVICMNSAQVQAIRRQAISESIPDRDIHIFDPANPMSPRLDLMSLPNNHIITFLDNVLNQLQENHDEYSSKERKQWITWMVLLEKAYAVLEHRSPTFSDLLEFFRNPSTIMDIHHYVEDNLDKFTDSWVKELTDTLDSHFHLGDSKQNTINFDIYEGLLNYRDQNILGKFLFDEDRSSVSLSDIWIKGGICIFSLSADLLSKQDAKTWGSIIRSNFSAGIQTKAKHSNETLISVYLLNASTYLDNNWYKLLVDTSVNNSRVSFNIAISTDFLKKQISNNSEDSFSVFLQSKRLIKSIYHRADTIDFAFYDKYKFLFSIERDQTRTLKQAIGAKPLPSGILITQFNNRSREIYRY